jgi:hypothetical protein
VGRIEAVVLPNGNKRDAAAMQAFISVLVSGPEMSRMALTSILGRDLKSMVVGICFQFRGPG